MSDDEESKQGSNFSRLRSNSLPLDFLQEPLVSDEERGESQFGNEFNGGLKHVHWSASTSSLTGLRSNSFSERPEEGGTGGEFVKSIVYGGLDAIVTSFALVASVSGSGIGSGAVLILGFANLVADGISMGFGDYLSSTTEENYVANEQKITDWEVGQDPENEVLNLVETYKQNGMDRSDADEVVKIFAKYKDLLVEQKTAIEDGLPSQDEEDEAWKNGLVTFVSFLVFGCTPLLPYVALTPFTDNHTIKFISACVLTGLALILLGFAKAHISGEKRLNAAMTIFLNGGIAALAAYGISWLLKSVIGISEP